MELVLNPDTFKKLKDNSLYNHNYYEGKYQTILEVCKEDYNFNEFYLVREGEENLFLGCSSDSLGSSGIVIIDFLEYYT